MLMSKQKTAVAAEALASDAATLQQASPATEADAASKKKERIGEKPERLGFLMHDVSRLRRTAFDEFMKPLGITRSQWWVLSHLSRHDGMIQSDLAAELELGKASLGGLIDRLEASGLVQRQPDDTDRRVKRVFLSVKATLIVKEMSLRSHEMSERILDGLSRPEREELSRLLLQVKRNLRAINDEGVDGAKG